jgi:hypothetical protein
LLFCDCGAELLGRKLVSICVTPRHKQPLLRFVRRKKRRDSIRVRNPADVLAYLEIALLKPLVENQGSNGQSYVSQKGRKILFSLDVCSPTL